VEHVAGQALGVDTDQGRLGWRVNLAHRKHNTLLDIRPSGAFKAEDTKMAEAAGKIRFRYFGQHPGNSTFIIMIAGA
jgi:hypothetical protein